MRCGHLCFDASPQAAAAKLLHEWAALTIPLGSPRGDFPHPLNQTIWRNSRTKIHKYPKISDLSAKPFPGIGRSLDRLLIFSIGTKTDRWEYDMRVKKRVLDSERRRWPRLKPSAVPFLKSVTLSQGAEVQAIDISRGGMLIETEVRLRPQMKIFLRLVTVDGIIKLEGSVVRSSITSLTGAPKYQSAISFEHPFHMLDDISEEPAAMPVSEPLPEAELPQLPIEHSSFQPIWGQFDEDSSVMTFITPEPQVTDIRDRLKTNDW